MLSILEYDEEWEKKKLRKAEYEAGLEEGKEEGIKAGIEAGRKRTIVALVCRKLQKGYSVKEIADMLEEKEETIRSICDAAEAYAPDYDTEAVWCAYEKQSGK